MRNIVYMGDIHLRDRPPANRIDNYMVAQLSKLCQLVDFANDNDADLYLGGDLYDTHRVSSALELQVIRILRRVNHKVVATAGQHDCPYHQMDLDKSPLGVLYAAGVIDLLQVDGRAEVSTEADVHFFGWESGWEDYSLDRSVSNIFLGHVSVFEKKIPFYWKGEAYTPQMLRDKYPGFDLYLCGDIHIPFVKNGVVVSGSMMRQSIDQKDYKPRCYLIDGETKDISPLFFEIAEDVFSVVEDGVEDLKGLEDLIAALNAASDVKASYRRDCLALAETDKEVKTIIEDIFDDIDGKDATMAD